MKIVLTFINYGRSFFSKLKEGGNLLKILGVIGIAINHVRIDFFRHVNSLSAFKDKQILENIYKKYEDEFKSLVDLNKLSEYRHEDYEILFQGLLV